VLGQCPLAHAEVHAPEQERAVTEALFDRVELQPEDLGNAGKHEYVADGHDRNDEIVGGQELCPLRNVRHAKPRFVQPSLKRGL
jgi:hypothetical protein